MILLHQYHGIKFCVMFNVEPCFVCDNATLTYVYTLSSQRNSDLLHSVGQSQTSNLKPKLKDMAITLCQILLRQHHGIKLDVMLTVDLGFVCDDSISMIINIEDIQMFLLNMAF